MRSLLHSRRARWAAPVAVAGAIALGSWIPTVTASASTPTLPSITAAQLLAKADHPQVKAFSGSIDLTANLGLPDLSTVTSEGGQGTHSDNSFDPTTLLSGTHQIKVWDNGADQQRLDLPSSLAEVDFIHNGDNAYYYDSSTQKVTHLVPGAHAAPSSSATSGAQTPDGTVPMTPEQVAQRFLANIDPSTTVTVASPVYVAGQATYQLELAPKAGTAGAAASTVSQISMAVDAQSGMVLSVAVQTKGQSAPALKVAFSSLSLATPAASNFTAPVGTSSATETVNGGSGTPAAHHDGAKPTVSGAPWAQVATLDHVNVGKSTHELDSVTSAVSGSFGSARLLHTAVVNALVFPDGKVLVGFVTPAALEAAAAG